MSSRGVIAPFALACAESPASAALAPCAVRSLAVAVGVLFRFDDLVR